MAVVHGVLMAKEAKDHIPDLNVSLPLDIFILLVFYLVLRILQLQFLNTVYYIKYCNIYLCLYVPSEWNVLKLRKVIRLLWIL